jgi:hypothetical protein
MTQVTIQEAPAAPAAGAGPQPGTPEYAAAMAAAYEAGNKGPQTELPVNAPASAEQKPEGQQTPAEGEQKPAEEQKPNEGEAKTEEKPADEQKPADEAKPLEGLAAFADVSTHLEDDGSFKPESLEALTKLGIPAEVSTALQTTFQELRELRAYKAEAETAKLTEGLHKAAGGKAEFDALISWGKANLTQQEREHLDGELNGPFAAQAIQLLKLRKGSSGDPVLHTANASASAGLTGYKSLAEQQADFQNPKYQTDPAFRQMVARRLALTP